MRSFINIYPLVITIPFAFALHAETAQCFSSCPSLHLRESERGHKLFLSSELSPEPSVGGGIFARTYGAYGKQLKEKPLRTQSATAGVISLFGDVLSQIVEAKALGVPFALNLARLSGFTIAGTIFSGPFVHLWYEFLWKIGRWQERRYGLGKFLVALTQNAVDQTLGVALFFPAYFYIYEYAEALVGFRVPSFAAATAKMKSEIGSVLVAQYRVWPLTNLINFSLIPEHLRVLTSNFVAVLWNAYLCTKVA